MDTLERRVLTASLLFVLAASALEADDTAYFVSTGGQFGTIDLNTGVQTILGTSANYQLAGLGQVGGTLYTAGYGKDGTLYTVNPASGALNAVGNSSIIFFSLGSTTTGLYAAGWPAGTNTQANPTLYFYSINPQTAAAKQIGQFGISPGFYAWSFSTGSPILYFADYENLYSIDPGTGNVTVIGGTSGVIPGGLAFENGKLYADANSPNDILTVNPASGAATVVTSFMGVAMAGLAPTNPQTSNPGVALPDVVAGDIWTTGFYVINTGTQTASYAINLFADSGAPLTLKFASGVSSVLSGTLPPNGSAYFEASDPSNPVQEGWAQVMASASVVVQALFRDQQPDGTYYEASVPSNPGNSKQFLAPFDYTTSSPAQVQLATGFAIANLDSQTANVTCTALDGNGSVIPSAVQVPAVNPLGHWAGFNFPALSGKRGTVDCISNTNIAALAVRYFGTKTFSSLPVVLK